MENLLELFENAQQSGGNINSNSKQQFIDLFQTNRVEENEKLVSEWVSELEAVLFNFKNNFTERSLSILKEKLLKKQRPEDLKINNIKGDANIFKNIEVKKSKTKTAQVNEEGEIVDNDDTFLKGKEYMLDPKNSYNSNLPFIEMEVSQHQNAEEIRFQEENCNKSQDDYLFVKIDKIKEAILSRITFFKDAYFKKYLEGNEVFANDINSEDITKSNEIKVVGRIVSNEKGLLNATNARIEASLSMYFDLEFDEEFDLQENLLFPNQIVMIQGLIQDNPTKLRVSKIITHHLQETEFTPSKEISNFRKEDAQIIVVAVGPFSTFLNTLYSPFNRLLESAKKRKASVLILLGPLLDPNNICLQEGKIESSPEWTFEKMQNSLIESALEFLGSDTHIIIVPSTKDILSINSVPQPPLAVKVSRSSNRIHCVSNPCTVDLDGELSISIANSDVAYHAIKNGVNNNKTSFINLAKLAFKTLFNQNNLYAMHPVLNALDSTKLAERVCIPYIYQYDCRYGRGDNIEESDNDLPDLIPKIVIAPSQLPKMAVVVSNTLVINPSYLVHKGKEPGNFGVITYFKNSSKDVLDRLRVDFYSYN